MNYSNPRHEVVIADYPIGGNRRGQCRFFVEKNKRGIRVGKQTFGKPSFDIYRQAVAICDGDDGRTYILARSAGYDFVYVLKSDFKTQEVIHKSNNPERYEELINLIAAVK